MESIESSGVPLASDVKRSMKLREEGGLGVLLVIIHVLSLGDSQDAVSLCERFTLTDPLHADHRRCTNWEEVLKGVANGQIDAADFASVVELRPEEL